MKSLFKTLAQLALVAFNGFGLGGCDTTRVPTPTTSPWQVVDLNTDANPLDVAFTDANHGFLVGSNRLILKPMMLAPTGTSAASTCRMRRISA